MKVFLVVTEKDGETKKEPGGSSTEIIKSQYRYAAESIEQVWEAFKNKGTAGTEETLVAIYEEASAITVLNSEK